MTTQIYDEMNNLIKLTNGCLETCEYVYDKWGRKESVTDGNGYQTTYRYDLAGNVCEVTNALGEKTSFTYDKENRLLTTTNPMGYVSSQTYDAVGNIETTTDAEGRTTKTLYTNHGDVKYQYDGEGRLVASMTYDAAYNLETVTDALGHTTTNTYTNMNQLKTSINPLGQKKIRGYDNRGNLNEVVDPPTLDRKESVVTKALYNAKGQVSTITDPEGNVQSYEYDTLGNLKYEHTAFGGTNSYTYNALNLLETSKNARGQSATYTYDAAGRVATMKDEVDKTTYEYDKNGNLLKVISKNNGTITRTFDALNRVKTYTDARGNTISYDYDKAGNLSKMTYPNGQVVTYQYDHAGLLTDVIDFNGGVTHYEYDNNGRVRMMTRPNGTSKETTYNVLGQVKTVIEKNSQGEMITQFGYDYDDAGNMIKETGLNENPEIASSETVMTYSKGNRLETYNGETVTYDADGNMTHGPLDGKMVDFVYDARNRLIQAGDTTYLYDAENNRIGMIEAGVKTTYTINPHAGLTEVLQSKKGNKVTQYIYGTGLIMQVTGGEYATYHYDFRGSTVAITDGKGKVTDTFTYSPYGKLLGRTGTTDTPFLYNGMYGVETDKNGLYCMRSRYYNPTIMRFINQDVVQGSLDNAITLNRYAYSNGNPVTYLDPFGNFAISLTLLAVAAVAVVATCAIVDVCNKAYTAYKKSDLAKLPTPSLGTPSLGTSALIWQLHDVDGSSALDDDQAGTGWIPRNIKGNGNKGGKKNNNKKPDYSALVATAAIITTANQIVRTIDTGTGQVIVEYEDGTRRIFDEDCITSEVAGKSKPTVNYQGKEVPVYRGGKDFKVKPNEVKVDGKTGLLKDTHGVSVDVNADTVSKFGGAYKIDSLPDGLKIIQRGLRPEHFEIVPSTPMTLEEFQQLLNLIEVSPV